LAKWNRLIEQIDPSHLAFIRGNQALLDWADAHKLPHLLVGSRDGGGNDRKLAIKLGKLVDHLLGELFAREHRRLLILLPAPNAEGVRFLSEKLVRQLGLDVATLMRERWVRHIPDGSAPARGKAVVEAVRSLQASAILAVNWEDYLMALTALNAAGIRVPADVSMACASHAPDLRHVLPPPAHFVIPESAFADGILRWMRTGKADPDRLTRLTLKSWTPGASLGKAR
jgi:DNA-binding LacI/PurR family transcriptional regulator